MAILASQTPKSPSVLPILLVTSESVLASIEFVSLVSILGVDVQGLLEALVRLVMV